MLILGHGFMDLFSSFAFLSKGDPHWMILREELLNE
jgi:hypothetical protein